MRNYLFLLPHQDDEVFVLPLIEDAVRNGDQLCLCFLTDGSGPEVGKVRNQESLRVLQALGVRPEQIKFVGQDLSIRDGKLCFKLSECFAALKGIIEKLGPKIELITTSFEGGHQDHDAAAILAHRLKESGVIESSKYFSTYNGYKTPGPFYRVSHLISKARDAEVESLTISCSDKWQIFKSIFSYPSQRKAWLLLSPFLIAKLLFRRSLQLESIHGAWPNRPHQGRLLYERHGRMAFSEFEKSLSDLA